METVRGFRGLPAGQRGPVIALGNFDGVHRGHQAILAQAAALARELDAPPAAAVFDPHPRRYFQPGAPPFRLMSDARRASVLTEAGAERLYTLPFDAQLAAMAPQDFVHDVLVAGLGVRGVVTGADFRFGRNRAGDAETLRALGEAAGVVVRTAPLVADKAEKVSSSAIRAALEAGDPTGAARGLGRPWIVDATVCEGDRRGRTIGFPTANLDLGDYVRPKFGVYAVTVGIGGEAPHRPAVANVGRRPTVGGLTERLEVHLFDFEDDLYGRELAVAFHDFLRAERKFDGLDALKAQIGKDADVARARLSARPAGPAR